MGFFYSHLRHFFDNDNFDTNMINYVSNVWLGIEQEEENGVWVHMKVGRKLLWGLVCLFLWYWELPFKKNARGGFSTNDPASLVRGLGHKTCSRIAPKSFLHFAPTTHQPEKCLNVPWVKRRWFSLVLLGTSSYFLFRFCFVVTFRNFWRLSAPTSLDLLVLTPSPC